jgi:general secretion pathway protein I
MSLVAKDAGFTLVEALVAMLILAIAAAGLIRASETHIDSVRDTERRTAAAMVARNRLAELSLPGLTSVAARATRVEMLGERWSVSEAAKPTADPDIAALTIAVRAADGRTPIVSLDGFVDTGR